MDGNLAMANQLENHPDNPEYKSTMKEKEILEGNILIQEFIGKRGNWLMPVRELKYHSSWDWLMPIIEKIASMDDCKYTIDISSVGMWTCYIKRDGTLEDSIADYGGFEPMILNVWKAVVKFIKYYNTHQR